MPQQEAQSLRSPHRDARQTILQDSYSRTSNVASFGHANASVGNEKTSYSELIPALDAVTINGYVRDIACLMKFNEALKPTNDCALMCARAGSALVIVTTNGIIYVPMSAEIPDTSPREKLIPFVGSCAEIKVEMFQRSGIKAIVIAQVKKADDRGVTSKK